MTEAELGGGFAYTAAGLTTGLLEDRYLKRVRALPEPTQRLLLIAAADATGDPTLLWRAAQAVGLGHDAAEPARAEQLLEIGSGVRFRHPLMRAAAYAAGSAEERRAAHRALAEAIDPEADPDRRVWHLAAAAAGPDEAVAGELERSAERAQARAGVAGRGRVPPALGSADRGAGPSRRPRPGRRARPPARRGPSRPGSARWPKPRRTRSTTSSELGSSSSGPRSTAPPPRDGRPRSSCSGRPGGSSRSMPCWPGRPTSTPGVPPLVAGALAAPGGELPAVSAAARAALAAVPGTEPVRLLLDGLSRTDPRLAGAAAPRCCAGPWPCVPGRRRSDRRVAALRRACLQRRPDAVGLRGLGRGERRHVDWRAAGPAHWPRWSQPSTCAESSPCAAGDFETARALGVAEEVAKQVTGTRRVSYGDLFLAAFEGSPERAHPLITAIADEARARGEGLGWNIADRAAALLDLGLGRYAEACAAAARAAEGNLGPFTAQALPDLVEAACRSGQPELAADALRRLQAATAGCDSDWAAGVEARSRALLSEGAEAEAAYDDAITRLARTPLRVELARAQLLYGEWLRREGRRADAREQLRAAHDTFAELGVEAFAERARRELVATGEKVRKRQVDTLNQLTPQEEHIARLARDGRTNPEIAAELFISARTVEWHLRKVFGKLVDQLAAGAARGAARRPDDRRHLTHDQVSRAGRHRCAHRSQRATTRRPPACMTQPVRSMVTMRNGGDACRLSAVNIGLLQGRLHDPDQGGGRPASA